MKTGALGPILLGSGRPSWAAERRDQRFRWTVDSGSSQRSTCPEVGGGAAGAKTWHGFVWASGMGCPAIRPCCPLPSARTGPAVRETRPRRTVLQSSASRRARVRVPRRARLPAPPPTSRIKRGLYSGSTLDNDSIALTTLSSARWEASPGVQPPTCGGRTRPPPGGHRDKVNDSANIRATV